MEVKLPEHKREFYSSLGGTYPIGFFFGNGGGSSGLGFSHNHEQTVAVAPIAAENATAQKSLLKGFIHFFTSIVSTDKSTEIR